ncbi:hypothetical protein P872_17880 [Rhodonellum psychrophilum GCM71 = DSM 17998]|uniref:Uncharacterized protein n=3 Tax=Cytophagaceae TaxID=89373 RepID=U5BPK4_9BACT|nr:hypothetical protein P872_17880 [Rhodonellum psychrophilum GCM71 = DSM 17998]SDY68489.1 hypothetical protein SAMN05444412_102229 [Rhodonellum ikkaensis]
MRGYDLSKCNKKRQDPFHGDLAFLFFCLKSLSYFNLKPQKAAIMREKLNASIQSLSLIIVAAGLSWVVWAGDTTMRDMLTYLIILVTFIEILSLYLVGKIYPDSHTTLKIGVIAGLLILLGIKTMLPSFFIPLTITVFALNFFYNFYTNNKRRRGTFRKKFGKKFKL